MVENRDTERPTASSVLAALGISGGFFKPQRTGITKDKWEGILISLKKLYPKVLIFLFKYFYEILGTIFCQDCAISYSVPGPVPRPHTQPAPAQGINKR